MEQLGSILIGMDFSPGAAAALRQGARLAQAAGGAKVHVVHVINTHVVVDIQHALSPLQKNIQAALETEARREWLKFEPDVPGKDTFEFKVLVGNPTVSILDAARDVKADVVVLGMHREPGAESGAGTVAAACVRKAEMPVLLVRPEQAGRFRRVMACVDFSELSRLAVVEAGRIARLDGATVDIVHVFEPPWRQLHYFAPMPENSPEFQAGYRAYMVARLREFCESQEEALAGVTHEYKLEEHHGVGRGVLDYAKAHGADLIVMGAHGRSNLRDFILGSTTERVLKQAPCSMLTVRARPSGAA